MNNIKAIIEKKMNELEESFSSGSTDLYIEQLTDYDCGYVSDIVSEIASSNTETGTFELIDMTWDLYRDGYTDRAVSEFGATDIIEILRFGHLFQLEEVLYDNLPQMIFYFVLHQTKELDLTGIREEDIEVFLDEVDIRTRGIDCLEEVEDILEDVVQEFSKY